MFYAQSTVRVISGRVWCPTFPGSHTRCLPSLRTVHRQQSPHSEANISFIYGLLPGWFCLYVHTFSATLKFDRFDIPATRAGKKLSQTINCKRCFWRKGTDLVTMFVQSKNAKGLSWVFKSSHPFNDMEMTWRILESVGNSFRWMKAIKSKPCAHRFPSLVWVRGYLIPRFNQTHSALGSDMVNNVLFTQEKLYSKCADSRQRDISTSCYKVADFAYHIF